MYYELCRVCRHSATHSRTHTHTQHARIYTQNLLVASQMVSVAAVRRRRDWDVSCESWWAAIELQQHSYRCHVLYIFHFNNVLQQRRYIQLDVVQRRGTPIVQHSTYIVLATLMTVASQARLQIAVHVHNIGLLEKENHQHQFERDRERE